MKPYYSIEYGNPSSLYSIGRRAKRALEEARRKIANIINCKPNEIYFTSCGTESDNLAIKGIAYANKEKGKHIITSKIEHPAVLNTCKELEEQGYKVNLIYFWLSSPDLAIQRVAQRVRNGGHDIPKEVVLRRYQAGIDNFFNIYMPCVDYWLLADNSETPRIIVAEGGRGMEMHIHHIERFNKIQSYVRE